MCIEPKVELRSVGLNLLLLVGVVVFLAGCGGYVETGYTEYDGPVGVYGPDGYLFDGGYYDRGYDVRAYSHRGHASRSVGHGGRRH